MDATDFRLMNREQIRSEIHAAIDAEQLTDTITGSIIDQIEDALLTPDEFWNVVTTVMNAH